VDPIKKVIYNGSSGLLVEYTIEG